MNAWASFLLETAIIAFPSHTIQGHIEGLVGVGIHSFSSVEVAFASALLASGLASVEVYICQGYFALGLGLPMEGIIFVCGKVIQLGFIALR